MAIERRGNGVYYYSYRRKRGRVVKEYGGSGYPAVLAARLDAANRRIRSDERKSRMIDDDLRRAKQTAERDWLAAVDRVVAMALEQSGWHCVRRQWRRKRGANMALVPASGPISWNSEELAVAAGILDAETAEKAKSGDTPAIQAIDEYLSHPAARALYGDVGRQNLNKWVKLYAGKNVAYQRGLIRFACDLRASLTGPNGSMLEQLVAERVVLVWLGNTKAVSQDHYLQVTDEHFATAIDGGAESAHQGRKIERRRFRQGMAGKCNRRRKTKNRRGLCIPLRLFAIYCTSVQLRR